MAAFIRPRQNPFRVRETASSRSETLNDQTLIFWKLPSEKFWSSRREHLLRGASNSLRDASELNPASEIFRNILLTLSAEDPSFGGNDEYFYAGLTNDFRLRLDSSCGGIFPYKSVKEARKLLDDLEAHYLDWSTDEEQEENQPAHLKEISSSDKHTHPTEDCTWKPTPLSQLEPHSGIIEQLFRQFSLEQGKMGTDVEQQIQEFVDVTTLDS
ncbi:hypothetical protein OSB04_016922 [Centaurea solstitialis]|uniref:Uncharacterized protein n=1 Tax=Centaurea solstitialis TaxID=347529 RepID=A0AA38W8Z3_9ASTR|nr:hypothetical protein OSB04_016922 [Centaurea solstitialis]